MEDQFKCQKVDPKIVQTGILNININADGGSIVIMGKDQYIYFLDLIKLDIFFVSQKLSNRPEIMSLNDSNIFAVGYKKNTSWEADLFDLDLV